MFVQGRGPGAGSRTELLEAFRESGNGVLLGAASFWQGVDVRGDALRNVIITRLPFDPPDRPLTEARLEAMLESKGFKVHAFASEREKMPGVTSEVSCVMAVRE